MSAETEAVEYRDAVGHPGYRVGSDGSVWSAWRLVSLGCYGSQAVVGDTWKRLKPKRVGKGGRYRNVCTHPGKVYRYIHHLVLEAFVGPCPEGMECCHGDGDPANCRLSNLRWDTPKGNAADKITHGTHLEGERVGNSKLTTDRVSRIRDRLTAGGVTHQQVADDEDVSRSHVGLINSGKTWKHVGGREALAGRSDCRSLKITINGETKSLVEWLRVYGRGQGCFRYRVNVLGWDRVRAITEPLHPKLQPGHQYPRKPKPAA